jgi:DNA-binding HxlR family transcriptional regulator
VAPGHPGIVGPVSETPDWRELDSGACSIARTMAVIGEPWTVLVLRDLLNGIRRFDELVDHLGIARNVLTRRLGTLVDAGLVETREYREPGRRARREYRPTTAGRDLRAVLIALMAYGDRHHAGVDGPPAVVEHDCGAVVTVQEVCADGHVLGPRDRVRTVPGPGSRRRVDVAAPG